MDSVDKLREIACQYDGLGVLRGNLNAIADEIERDYMRLPVDADGVPIRVGDWLTDGAEEFPVMAVNEGGFCRGSKVTSGWYFWDDPQDFRHYHAPTVEDVLRVLVRDVRRAAEDFASEDGEEAYIEAAIGECEDKLREVMRDE